MCPMFSNVTNVPMMCPAPTTTGSNGVTFIQVTSLMTGLFWLTVGVRKMVDWWKDDDASERTPSRQRHRSFECLSLLSMGAAAIVVSQLVSRMPIL
jgi:hypothetical protein